MFIYQEPEIRTAYVYANYSNRLESKGACSALGMGKILK
jgi:hypothetical protein